MPFISMDGHLTIHRTEEKGNFLFFLSLHLPIHRKEGKDQFSLFLSMSNCFRLSPDSSSKVPAFEFRTYTEGLLLPQSFLTKPALQMADSAISQLL